LFKTWLNGEVSKTRNRRFYEARDKFRLHLGYESKVQLDQGDQDRFVDENLLVFNRENGAIQHAIPLQSVIYVSMP